MFRKTLKEEVISWYERLPKGSIKCFHNLKSAFQQAYNHQARRKACNAMLLNIKQRLNETLREFVKRFLVAVQEANNPLDEITILAL